MHIKPRLLCAGVWIAVKKKPIPYSNQYDKKLRVVISNEPGFWQCIRCDAHNCTTLPEYIRGSRKRALTLSNALVTAEDSVRNDREVKPVALGKAVLKKFALPEDTFRYKQCLRMKRRATRLVDGDVQEQFSKLLSCLEI